MTQAHRTLTQKTASGVAWITGFQIARQLLQVVSVSILARRVPPAAYGLMAMALLVTNALETIRDLGIGQALVREREMPDELASTGFWLNIAMGGSVTLLIIAASWPAARFFHEPQVAVILRFLAIAFFLGAVNVVSIALLNREMAFRKLAIAQTTGAACGAAVGITVALLGGKLWSLVSGSLTTTVATTIAVWYFSPLRVKPVFRITEAKRILRFGIHLSGFYIFNYFSRNTDNLLIARFLGSAPLGFYQMGYMLMTYPLQNFTLMVSQVVYPALSRFPDELDRFRAAYLRTCALISLVTFPLMLGLAVTAEPFVRVFLGPRWMAVAGLLLVFAPLGAAQSLYATVGLIYNTQGRPDLQFKWTAFASTLYVISFIVGLRWGIMGVASCYALVWAVLMVPGFMIAFRLVRLSGRTFFRTIWPTLWMSVLMAVVSRVVLLTSHSLGVQNAGAELVIAVSIGLSAYVALLLWRRPPAVSELTAILLGSSNPVLRRIATLLAGTSQITEGGPKVDRLTSTDI